MAFGKQQGVRPGWLWATGGAGLVLGLVVGAGTGGDSGDLDDIEGGGVAKTCQTADDGGINRPGIPANGLAAAWQRFTTADTKNDNPPVAYTCLGGNSVFGSASTTLFVAKDGTVFNSRSGAVTIPKPQMVTPFAGIVANRSGDGYYLLDKAGNIVQQGNGETARFALKAPLAPGLTAVNLTVSDDDDAAALTVVDEAGKQSFIQLAGGQDGRTVDIAGDGNRTSYSFGTSPVDATRLSRQIEAHLVANDKTHDDESLAPADMASVMEQLTTPQRDVGPASLELVL